MGKKILLIDDDQDFVNAVAATLKAKDYVVISANDGNAGFAAARDQNPDLILLDVMMTKKTEGFDVARLLKKEKTTKNIPVVLISGIRKEMNLPFGFESDENWLPVKFILEKPVKPQILLDTITEMLK